MAKIQLIRSATLKIQYAGTTFLIDPMLGEKGSFESYGGIDENPIKNLHMSIDEVLENVDRVLVTHLHKDHFDDKAREVLNKSIPIICQPGDRERIEESGFTQVDELASSTTIKNITISRTRGNHGRGPIEKLMGNVSGFVLQSENEPTIYIVGDCIFNDRIKEAIDRYKPNVIITNSGGAFIPGYEQNLILLDEEETLELALYAKESQIVAVHLEGLDHSTVSRASLKRALLQSDVNTDRFLIPLDGEILEF
jgi:L-ascorbate metabolism protein UlaG (beta-lactamase superfamily)